MFRQIKPFVMFRQVFITVIPMPSVSTKLLKTADNVSKLATACAQEHPLVKSRNDKKKIKNNKPKKKAPQREPFLIREILQIVPLNRTGSGRTFTVVCSID